MTPERPTGEGPDDYIADRGCVLSHGEIVLRGEAAELRRNHELLISSYFGEHTELFAGKGP